MKCCVLLALGLTAEIHVFSLFGGGGENRTLTKSLQSSQAPITSHPPVYTNYAECKLMCLKMAPQVRFERTTNWLTANYSTTELLGNYSV